MKKFILLSEFLFYILGIYTQKAVQLWDILMINLSNGRLHATRQIHANKSRAIMKNGMEDGCERTYNSDGAVLSERYISRKDYKK
jgi:flagellar biosynthesis/type III secretory pathway chaperone